jgi:exosortase
VVEASLTALDTQAPTAERRRRAPATPSQIGWLAAAVVVLGLVYLPTVQWLFERWTLSVWHNAHGMLIPPAVAYFAYLELARVRELPPSASAWGFLFVIPALALHVLDTGMHTQLLSAASIVLLLPGLSLVFLGRARTTAIAFPLAFMALMLPIPLALTEPIHAVLRQIATAGTAAVIPFLGITAFVEGTTFHLPRATLHVGDGCSGFSTLYASLAVAALTAYTTPVVWRRVLVLLAAAPIAIASNVLRVVLLTAMVSRTGVDVLSTWVHPASGMMTFGLALPVIFWLGSAKAANRPSTEVRA